MTPGSWVRELSATIPTRRIEREDRDFGGNVWQAPSLVVQTETTEQVLRVFDLASRHGIPVATRGAGHSSGGHTAAPGGIVLRHAPRSAELQLVDGVADVPAHHAWSRVESALRARGRDLMVATSSLDTTVAGTLSMGGFGVRSVRLGAQVDHVTALRLVLPDGRVLWCSATEEAELFRSALTGVGQVGLIERALMHTAVPREHLACAVVQHANFGELASCITWLEASGTDAPDYFAALWKNGVLESTFATAHFSHAEAAAALGRNWQNKGGIEHAIVPTRSFEAVERQMPLDHFGRCRNLWCDYAFDSVGFSRFCDFVDDELARDLPSHLAYVMSLAPRAGVSLALDMRPRSDTRSFSFGLFYSVPEGDAAGVARAAEAQRRALAVCSDLGGRPYLYGFWGGVGGLSMTQLSSFFPEGYPRLLRVRAEVDPHRILNPNSIH
jgi:FAD/FMN-containing dehydrogenase